MPAPSTKTRTATETATPLPEGPSAAAASAPLLKGVQILPGKQWQIEVYIPQRARYEAKLNAFLLDVLEGPSILQALLGGFSIYSVRGGWRSSTGQPCEEHVLVLRLLIDPPSDLLTRPSLNNEPVNLNPRFEDLLAHIYREILASREEVLLVTVQELQTRMVK